MKKLIFRLAAFGAVLVMIICFQTGIFSQTKPLTIDQISRAISTFSKDKKLFKKIISDVRSRGVDFLLTAENETRLRKEGATNEFLEVIRDNSPSLPKPTVVSSSTITEIPTPTAKPVYSTYLERGDEFFNKFDFDRAIEEYSKVIELDSQNVYALVQKGYARHYTEISTNDFLADYNSAVKIDPDLALKSNMICVLYNPSQDNSDNAVEACSKALSAQPKFSLFYYKRGNAYLKKREWVRAIKDYSEAINIFPNFYNAFINRGIAFRNSQNTEKALADFDKAIMINPNKILGYVARGELYNSFSKRDFDKALADFNKVLELDSKNILIYLERGRLYYFGKKDFDKAFADFNRVLELDSKNGEAYRMRGLLHIGKNRDYDKAFADFNKSVV